MKTRRYITMMLFLLMYITAMAQNNLSVGKLTGGQGKDVLIPISLENTDEVVALSSTCSCHSTARQEQRRR